MPMCVKGEFKNKPSFVKARLLKIYISVRVRLIHFITSKCKSESKLAPSCVGARFK